MKQTAKILLIFLVIILLFLLAYGIILNAISNSECKNICQEKGALTSDVIASGSWILYDDFCICYFKDRSDIFDIREEIGK